MLEYRLKFHWSLFLRVSRPQFCWGLAILCDPPFFSGYIEFGGVVVKFYPSVEITLYLLADFLLQYVQCLPFYIINEVGHLTTSVDHLAEFCQNYHLAAICTQLMVKFFLQLRFI